VSAPTDTARATRWLLPDSVFDGAHLVAGRAVGLDGDRIVAVVPDSVARSEAARTGAALETLAGRALLPGFVNAHSHAFQRGLRGHVQHAAAGADDFWTWRTRMYALANALDPDALEAASARAFSEMLAAGYTSVGEFHYLQHAPDGTRYADPDELALRVVAAAERVGIRIVLLRVAYARAGFGAPENPHQRRFLDRDPEDVLTAIARLRARGVRAGLAPHSVRAVPRPWLETFARAGVTGPVHAHVDEQPAEVAACLAEHGLRPLQLLDEVGLLGPAFTAVHLTHPDADEVARLHRAGAGVCACPSTELDLGDGFLPLQALDVDPDAGPPRVSIGSDSHALIDPFAELRALEWHARAQAGRRNVLRHAPEPDALAARLLAMGTRVGAEQLALDAGAIAPGMLADLVAIDLTHPALLDAAVLPALVFAGSPALVREVWVGGRQVRGPHAHR
jgi:formimidoylglutamate deiminase